MSDPSVDDIKNKIKTYNSGTDDNKTLDNAMNIFNGISSGDFSNILEKYKEINDDLIRTTDYEDGSSTKYKIGRILETYLAKNKIFKSDNKNFNSGDSIIIFYNSREGVLPWEGCFIYKKFEFILDEEEKKYTGLNDISEINTTDVTKLKKLFPIICSDDNKRDVKINDTNKILKMYFIEKTTKVRLDDSNNKIKNFYCFAKVVKEGNKLKLKYYKIVMKDEATNTIEIKLEDAKIP